jgi:hypothetical protein
MQLTTTPTVPDAIIKPTTRGHNFTADRYRGRHRVAPLETVDHSESTADPTTRRVYCPKCEKCYAAAVDYQVIKNRVGHPVIVKRVAFCDACPVVFFWDQHCDVTGRPFGCRPIKGSLVMNDKQSVIERVLKVYPQLRGVQQI